MKIFIYAGSRRSEKSNTLKVVNKLVCELKKKIDVKVILRTPENTRISNCTGCINCFKTGKCQLDFIDDMNMVKNEMLESDVIIIASPVYFHHVNGYTKNFIDRIAYWSHIFSMVGKVSVTISVSSTNGNQFVDFYLKKVLEGIGTINISTLSLPIGLLGKDEINNKIIDCSSKIIKNISNVEELRGSTNQEFLFKSYKKIYEEEFPATYESRYWNDNKYFKCNSFNQLYFEKTRLSKT